MSPAFPDPIEAFDQHRLLGDLLRSHLPLDEADYPEELRNTDLILRDLDPEVDAEVDSSRSALDEGLEVRHPAK